MEINTRWLTLLSENKRKSFIGTLSQGNHRREICEYGATQLTLVHCVAHIPRRASGISGPLIPRRLGNTETSRIAKFLNLVFLINVRGHP